MLYNSYNDYKLAYDDILDCAIKDNGYNLIRQQSTNIIGKGVMTDVNYDSSYQFIFYDYSIGPDEMPYKNFTCSTDEFNFSSSNNYGDNYGYFINKFAAQFETKKHYAPSNHQIYCFIVIIVFVMFAGFLVLII